MCKKEVWLAWLAGPERSSRLRLAKPSKASANGSERIKEISWVGDSAGGTETWHEFINSASAGAGTC